MASSTPVDSVEDVYKEMFGTERPSFVKIGNHIHIAEYEQAKVEFERRRVGGAPSLHAQRLAKFGGNPQDQ